MRGYASSRAIWPMEFGLLHSDAQWVFDEVQLMGAGRATSAQLEAFRRSDAVKQVELGYPQTNPARSLWISATLEPDWLKTVDFFPPAEHSNELRRVDPAQEPGDRLRRLANAKKALAPATFAPDSSKAADVRAYIAELARSVLRAHRPGHMSLVVLNRVRRAQHVHVALAKEMKGEATPTELALVHGRFRPADRKREFEKVVGRDGHGGVADVIVVATQAVEAGVDFSAAVLWTELAPWSSMVQRFGRANRYAELDEGANVQWLDLLAGAKDAKTAETLALPYSAGDMEASRRCLRTLTDAAPARLPAPGNIDPPLQVIRRKDLDDLFDTDPDLTGFDVDISPYVRDADGADVRIFWRDTSSIGDTPPYPRAEELCSVPIGAARDWLEKLKRQGKQQQSVFVRDPQWRPADGTAASAPPGWTRLASEPWPGLLLLADTSAGGYRKATGFTGDPKDIPKPVASDRDPTESRQKPDARGEEPGGESETHDADPRSEIGTPVLLATHLRHVEQEAGVLCDALRVDADVRAAVVRAARWHDLGKVHDVFQETMRRGLDGKIVDGALAKTVKSNLRHGRPYFRHELASALALLAHEEWSRDADLTAYLVAAHHGKVRMNLRALPRESAPVDTDRADARFARGVWEGDELNAVDLGGGERWAGGPLTLSLMELGWDETTRESWTERTRDLLKHCGPFRLAWMETLVRVADWRASAKERERVYGDT